MVTIHESHRLEADTQEALARVLYRYPSMAIKPTLVYVYNTGWMIAVTRIKDPGEGWRPLALPTGESVGWILPVEGEGL